jgi:hypothetical protein
VIEAHRSYGLPVGSPFTLGEAEPWVGGFDSNLGRKIEPFLRSLRLDLEDAANAAY